MRGDVTNTGKPYEQLVRGIYDQILKLDGIENVDVRHDVKLAGISGIVHQIDVVWEFRLGGILHRVIVQAKDWGTRVDQGEILKFQAVLSDVPGQPRGVIVAKSGFQSGALDFAKSHGIVLYELREIRMADFAGRVREVVVDLVAFCPDFRKFNFEVDEDWAREQSITSLAIGAREDEMLLTNARGESIGSVHLVKHKMITPALEDFDWKLSELKFKEDTFLQTGDATHPRLKLLGMHSEVKVQKIANRVGISYEDLFESIFASVTGGDNYLIDGSGRVSRKE
jgi:Restriction endonuclease